MSRDLAEMLAGRICAHVRSTLRESSFGRKWYSSRGHEFSFPGKGGAEWTAYVSNGDANVVVVRFDGPSEAVDHVFLGLNIGDGVPKKYVSVVSRVHPRKIDGDGFCMNLHLNPTRSGNASDLLYAVYNLGVKPVFRAIAESSI